MTNTELQFERERLRQELLMQRLIVEQAFSNVREQSPARPLSQARSKTMRFIQDNSSLVDLLGRGLKSVIASRLSR